MYSYGAPYMAKQKQDDQLEHTYSSYVRIRDVTLKTCQKRWMIGRSGERGSGISVLAPRHDDDEYIFLFFSFIFVPNFRHSWLGTTNISHHILQRIAFFEWILWSFPLFQLTVFFCWSHLFFQLGMSKCLSRSARTVLTLDQFTYLGFC